MDESPYSILKNKRESTIVKLMESLKSNLVDVVFSAGNSGAVVFSAEKILGVQEHHLTPAICTILPSLNRDFIAIADIGSSANKPIEADNLVNFATLGMNFLKEKFNLVNPKIALLNVGIEDSKGNLEHRKAYKILKENKSFNFIGNIEADSLLNGEVDLVVTDGFTGNIVLKLIESFNTILKNNRILENKSEFANFISNKFKYEYVGGAPLLGVNGKVVIGHGKSNREAVVSGLKFCKFYA